MTRLVPFALALLLAPLAQADTDGSFDTGFDFDGQRVEANVADERAEDTLEVDGHLYVASVSNDGSARLRAYTSSGQLDTQVFPGGKLDLGMAFSPATGLFLVQLQHAVMVVGTVYESPAYLPGFCLAGPGVGAATCGAIVAPYPAVSAVIATGVVRDASGDIVIAATTATDTLQFGGALIKLKTSQSLNLDPDFGSGGVKTFNFSRYALSQLGGLVVDAARRIRVAGISTNTQNGAARTAVMGFLPNGDFDIDFGSGSVAYVDYASYTPQPDDGPESTSPPRFRGLPQIVGDARGRWLVASNLGSAVGIGRLLADGSTDLSFGAAGQHLLPATGPHLVAMRTLKVDGGGHALIAGRAYDSASASPERAGIVRLRPDGGDDCTFANAIAPACGQFFYYNAPVNVVQALRFDTAGRLLAVGYGGTRYGTLMTSVDGDAATARLNYDHIFQDGLE